MSTDSGPGVNPAWNLNEKNIVFTKIVPNPLIPTSNDITESASTEVTYPLGVPGSQKEAQNLMQSVLPISLFKTVKTLVEKVLSRLEQEFVGPGVPLPIIRKNLIQLRQFFLEVQKYLPQEVEAKLPKEVVSVLKRLPKEIKELTYFIQKIRSFKPLHKNNPLVGHQSHFLHFHPLFL